MNKLKKKKKSEVNWVSNFLWDASVGHAMFIWHWELTSSEIKVQLSTYLDAET